VSGPVFRRTARRPAEPWHRRGLPGRVRAYLAGHRVLPWAVGIAAVCLVAGYLLTWVVFFPGFGRSAIVTVPDVTGMQRGAAQRTLGRLGLEVERGDPVPNPRMAEGRILMQVPLPGEEVPRGSTVRIVPSAGPVLRTVPAVRGLSRTEAVGLLERYGFRVRVTEVGDRREEGTLLGLRPAAGEPAAVGSAVELVVSAGPPFVAVPGVVGIPHADARLRLEGVGLTVRGVSYSPGSAEPEGTVVAQVPAAGDSLRMGSGVRLTLAGEDPTPPPPPEPEPVPEDLDGDGVPDAPVEVPVDERSPPDRERRGGGEPQAARRE
jgi:eukaryotic-like serine/threonine-protein kinase